MHYFLYEDTCTHTHTHTHTQFKFLTCPGSCSLSLYQLYQLSDSKEISLDKPVPANE